MFRRDTGSIIWRPVTTALEPFFRGHLTDAWFATVPFGKKALTIALAKYGESTVEVLL